MSEKTQIAGILTLAAVGTILILSIPLAAIWSVNTLFGLTIPYTFKTWLAAFILIGVSGSPHMVKK